MISDYYSNNFVTYTKSGSITADGTYIFTSSLGLSGKCRIEPITDVEGDSTHRIFMASQSLDYVDTIYVDSYPYELVGIKEFQNKTQGHHLELDVKVV